MIEHENIKKGYSLVEMLIVIFIFTILAVIVTQSLALSLRGSRKSENISDVKSNIELAVAVMERNLRTAKVRCGDSTASKIEYNNQLGNAANFECVGTDPNDRYIASNSARLTNTMVNITNCSIFTCNAAAGGVPTSVDINITAQDASALGAEGSTVTIRTKILTRDY